MSYDPICPCGQLASEHPHKPTGQPICFGDENVRAFDLIASLDAKIAELRSDKERLLEGCKIAVAPIGHSAGCLYLERRDLPCQCGFNDRINKAIDKIRTILSSVEAKCD